MPTHKKWLAEIKMIVEGEGCRLVSITQTRKHNRVEIILPSGLARKLFTCVSPSDSRKGGLNFRNDIRKLQYAERADHQHR